MVEIGPNLLEVFRNCATLVVLCFFVWIIFK